MIEEKTPRTKEEVSIFDEAKDALRAKKLEQEERRGQITAKTMALAATLHRNNQTETNEPDWQGQMLVAKTGQEKMQIRAAKEAWHAEQKWARHVKAQDELKNQVAAVKQVTIRRNKAFYDELRRKAGSVFWSVETQRLMRQDKTTLGLKWYSK